MDSSIHDAAACVPQLRPLEFLSSEGKRLDEATAAEGIAEAEEASARFLSRGLLDAEEELNGELDDPLCRKPAKKSKSASKTSADGVKLREAWRERARTSKDARVLRGLLAELGEQMAAEAEDAWLRSDDPAIGAAARASIATSVESWRARMSASWTHSQLALRLIEIESSTLERDGMRSGVPLQVCGTPGGRPSSARWTQIYRPQSHGLHRAPDILPARILLAGGLGPMRSAAARQEGWQLR